MSDIAEEKRSPSPSPEPELKTEEPKKKKYVRRYGTRSEVFDSETAEMTRGGLRKADLVLSRTGKIVSKKKSESVSAKFGNKPLIKRSKTSDLRCGNR